jgi:hypothetical protein
LDRLIVKPAAISPAAGLIFVSTIKNPSDHITRAPSAQPGARRLRGARSAAANDTSAPRASDQPPNVSDQSPPASLIKA